MRTRTQRGAGEETPRTTHRHSDKGGNIMQSRTWTGALALLVALIPGAALAHTGQGHTHDFFAGFAHPLGGLDHILAMVAVGVFAAQIGGRALWLTPLAFVSMMVVGGVLGANGVALPFVETGVAASVVALGLAVALRWSPPALLAAAFVGLFAIFHGHAHGAEMTADANGLAYGGGFVTATALLHAAGVGLGLALARVGVSSPLAPRTAGAATAAAGLAIIGGVL